MPRGSRVGDVVTRVRSARTVRAPLVAFSVVYIAFLAVLWVPLATWMPSTLRRLTVSPSLFGYTPSLATELAYLSGLVSLWVGYLVAQMFWRPVMPVPRQRDLSLGLTRVMQSLVGVSVLAFVVQLALVHAIPLFDLQSRWTLNAKLVAVFSLGFIGVGGLIAGKGWTKLNLVLLGALTVAAGLLGGRTLPLAAVGMALALAGLLGSRRMYRRTLALVVACILVVSLTVGGISKSQIYGGPKGQRAYDPMLGIGLFQSDSIGTFYNLQRVVDLVDNHGAARDGHLLLDTLLNMIPGIQRDYANFQLGTMLGGRTTVTVNGHSIERSVSLTTTFVGAPYGDGGLIVVLVVSLLLGIGWWFFETMALLHAWYAGVFGFWVARMLTGIYGSVYNESMIWITALAVIGAMVLAVQERRRSRVLDGYG
jgi:hypothetical protein